MHNAAKAKLPIEVEALRQHSIAEEWEECSKGAVKRQGRCSLVDAYAVVQDGEAYLMGAHIPEYTEGTWNNHTPRRSRKLLLHRKEIDSLVGRTRESGLALVPLSLYFKDGRAKVEVALARGRKAHDKRQVLAERDAQREIRNAMGRAVKRGRR